MATECAEDILIDLASPESPLIEPLSCSSPADLTDKEDKENANLISVSDSIEMVRGDVTDRRNSLTLQTTPDTNNRILRDVTQQSTGKNIKNSPVIRLLDEEVFDFDLPTTPDSGINQRKSEPDDDEEVFIGPMGFREQCVAAVVSAEDQIIQPISPLGPEQYAELFKEANLVAYRLKNTKSGSEESNKSSNSLQISALSFKSSSSSSEGESSPANRRHSRGGTFTISKSPYELLTEKQKRTLPVVDKTDDTVKMSLDSHLTKDENSNKENIAVQSRLGVPKPSSKLTRLSMNKSNISKTNNKENVKSSEVLDSGVSKATTTTTTATTNTTNSTAQKRKSLQKPGTMVSSNVNGPKKISRLQPVGVKPGTTSTAVPQSKLLKPSNVPLNKSENSRKLEAPGTRLQHQKSAGQLPQTTTEKTGTKSTVRRSLTMPKSGVSPYLAVNKDKKSEVLSQSQRQETTENASKIKKLPQRSSLPNAVKASVNSGIPCVNGPVTKQQLMKPGELQRKSFAFNRGKQTEVVQKSGPVKAMVPPQPVNSLTVVKRRSTELKNKDLPLAVPESTPVKPDKRVQPKILSNDFKTPRKSSTSSVDSISGTPSSARRRSCLPTPSKSRTSSQSSVSQSPLVRVGATRHSSTSSCPDFTEQHPAFDDIDDKSPTALQPRNPKVVNTPNLPQKKFSAWSPIKKKHPVPLTSEDTAFICTKKTTNR